MACSRSLCTHSFYSTSLFEMFRFQEMTQFQQSENTPSATPTLAGPLHGEHPTILRQRPGWKSSCIFIIAFYSVYMTSQRSALTLLPMTHGANTSTKKHPSPPAQERATLKVPLSLVTQIQIIPSASINAQTNTHTQNQ